MPDIKYHVGYSFNGKPYCIDCILRACLGGDQDQIGYVFSVDAVLDVAASLMDIDREAVGEYSDQTFPKRLYQNEKRDLGLHCVECVKKLDY